MLALAALAALSALAVTGARAGPRPPRVHLDVTLDAAAHTVSGEMTVGLDPDDPRAGGPLWFHLPPNRFAARDPRGHRRDLAPIPFAISYLAAEIRDTWLPDGFSPGSIAIESVRDEAGRPLATALVENPRLTLGFATAGALLRVDPPPGAPLRALTIRFTTRLPHRVVDGWSGTAWVLAHWFPEPAAYGDGAWVFDPERPHPARYSAWVGVTQDGWLATGRGFARHLDAGGGSPLPEGAAPEKGLPLAWLPAAERTDSAAGLTAVVSLHTAAGARIAGLSHRIAQAFLEFAEDRFRLPPPGPSLAIVQADLPPEETLTLGRLIVVSKDFTHQSPLLDRVYVGTLAGALARVWFGETVWCDEEREAWLPLGFAGYFSLRFFEARYGWDARIHTITDWLSPRYREHYFEQPVRDLIRDGEDAPLLIPLAGYPRARTARVVLHRKAPLVLRSLDYVVGEDAFIAALGTFVTDYAQREATHDEWQAAVQRASGQDLDWFFDEWFHRTPDLDYAIGSAVDEPADGEHRLAVTVERLGTGTMPVQVRVTLAGGGTVTQRTPGTAAAETVRFTLPGPAESVDLDPDEYLVESDRRNNHSETEVRVRPFFDWSKQREVLVSVRGRAGGNAVDGNYAGLGVNVQIDVDDQVRFIPIYGELTGWGGYDVGWDREHFLHPRVTLGLAATRLGGLRSRSLSLSYRHDLPDDRSGSTGVAFDSEEVDGVHRVDEGRVRDQAPGQANNVELFHSGTALWSERWSNEWGLSYEHSQSSYGSDFDYSLLTGRVVQGFNLTPDHGLRLELLREATSGAAPLQRQPLLGDPLVLRGYPRSFRLVSEQLAAARLEYHWTVSRAVYGREIQSRRVQLIFFADSGKGWDNGQSPADTPQRQDAGIGIEIDINVAGLVVFPARLEVGVPYNDPQYRSARLVFFQALSFY